MSKAQVQGRPSPPEPWAVVIEWTDNVPTIVGPFPNQALTDQWLAAWTHRPPNLIRTAAVAVGSLLDALAVLWE